MSVKQDSNLSYMLHLWQVERNGKPVWWASLENPRTGERQAFADLEALMNYLEEKLQEANDCILGTEANSHTTK